MSPEAAYFPDGMPSALEVRRAARGAAEASLESPGAYSGGKEAVNQPARTVTPLPEIPDERLMEQVRQGTKEALVPLFRRHAHVVRSVACRILRNEAEADDLCKRSFSSSFGRPRCSTPHEPPRGRGLSR